MTDEMKLIMALCNVLGFDIETKLDYQERRISKSFARAVNSRIYGNENELTLLCIEGEGQLLDIDENGMYLARLTKPIISYKLTPKGDL